MKTIFKALLAISFLGLVNAGKFQPPNLADYVAKADKDSWWYVNDLSHIYDGQIEDTPCLVKGKAAGAFIGYDFTYKTAKLRMLVTYSNNACAGKPIWIGYQLYRDNQIYNQWRLEVHK